MTLFSRELITYIDRSCVAHLALLDHLAIEHGSTLVCRNVYPNRANGLIKIHYPIILLAECFEPAFMLPQISSDAANRTRFLGCEYRKPQFSSPLLQSATNNTKAHLPQSEAAWT